MKVAVVLLAFAVAGCASSGYASSHPSVADSGHASATASGHASAATSGRASAAAPRHSPAPVSVQVKLPSRTMEAGSSMLAHIIVDNRTGHAIHAYGCVSLFELTLGNSSHPAGSAWLACLQRLTIAAGESSYPETVTASYGSCGRVASAGLPACLPDGRPPPLPAGKYRVVFFQSGHIVPAPAPIPVQVTPRP